MERGARSTVTTQCERGDCPNIEPCAQGYTGLAKVIRARPQKVLARPDVVLFCQTLLGQPRAARPSGRLRFAEGKTAQTGHVFTWSQRDLR